MRNKSDLRSHLRAGDRVVYESVNNSRLKSRA